MPEKTKKPDGSRKPPQRLPVAGEANVGTAAFLLEGVPLEDTVFAQIDLSSRRIAAIRGSNMIFDRVSFANSDIGSLRLFDARFMHCDLSNAIFRNFEATRVEFVECRLTGLNALGCRWQDVLLEHCDARFAQFSESRLRRCEIVDSQFRESALNRVEFEATRLREVVLRQADLAETRLAGLDLSSCDIEGIVLHVEDLRGVTVSPAQAMDLARFLEVIVK
jgi:uncharacterized protein YjbI with pentapeptide repeats